MQKELGDDATLEIADIRLPLYNQDADHENADASVQTLRRVIAEADGLVITTPEYNHGMPGVLKNALDWASRPSGKSCLQDKPTLIITNSPGYTGGVRAQAQLNETLLSVSAVIVPGRQVVIGNVAAKIVDDVFVDKENIVFAMQAVKRLIKMGRLDGTANEVCVLGAQRPGVVDRRAKG